MSDLLARSVEDDLHEIVDVDRFPLAAPESPRWNEAVMEARVELRHRGCTILRDFIRPDMRSRLRDEGVQVAPHAYYDEMIVNVYNTEPDEGLPDDHPARILMVRGNAFVPRDRIPESFLIHRLYVSEPFQRFLAACLEVDGIFPLADPLAGLCLNIVRPEREHPWHFDTNEFAISLLTQESTEGGVFEYCPGIRSAGAEHTEDVKSVITGDAGHLVQRLRLRPGDLQLFRGRYSLHRVSPVQGTTERHTAILSYSQQPGVVGRSERTRQLFGRLSPEHGSQANRVDDLLD